MDIMEVMVNLNKETASRDELVRLLQYGSRVYFWYFRWNKHCLFDKYSVELLRNLDYSFSTCRKILRFGECIESFYEAIKIANIPNLLLRVTLTLSKLANGLYLLADHLICANRIGIFKVNLEKWNNIGKKYWLMSIIMNLVRDVYEISRHDWSLEKFKKDNKDKRYKSFKNLKTHVQIVLDTVKNGCDLFVSLTALGFTKFTPGIIGLLGVISSAINLYTIIYPFSKIHPS